MSKEKIRAMLGALAAAFLLAGAIYLGSGKMERIDAALVGYAFATLFAAIGITYRYILWLQRPPTQMYLKRGIWSFFRSFPGWKTAWQVACKLTSIFVLNLFIWRRSFSRGLTHTLIFWGCLLAGMITFPLVFGWIHFDNLPGDFNRYQAFIFGIPLFSFPLDSLIAKFIFHGLVWSALLVIPGVLIAFHRRIRDHGAAAAQNMQEDLLPLILLFAVSISGLMLTVSYTWMKGYGYEFLAVLHAVTVIFTLLWLPFGKLFHIFQRPAQVGVVFYRVLNQRGPQMRCLRCHDPFAGQVHIHDLIDVEKKLGYQFDLDPVKGNYQEICSSCKRKMLALAQRDLWKNPETCHGH